MPPAVDRELLHRFLWDKSDRQGRLKMHQRHLATDLGITHYTMSRIVAEMLAEGRLKKLATHHGNYRTYLVRDPDKKESTDG